MIRSFARYILGFSYWHIYNLFKGTRIKNYNVSINSRVGKKVLIRSGTYIYGNITIGDYSYVSGPHTYVDSASIGKFCSIARSVTIGPGNHNLGSVTTHPILDSSLYGFVKTSTSQVNNRPPIIGNDVWIGINSTILNNVIVSDGAIIGAGAVVTKDVAPYSVVGGVPARHIKFRFSEEQIDSLLRIKWWDWPLELISQRIDDFNNVELFISKYDS